MSLVHKWCFLFIHNICRTKNPISCEDGYKQTKIYLYSIFSFPASKMNQMEVIVWLLYHQLQQPWSTTLRTRMGQVWASSCSPSSTASRRQLWLWLSTSAPTCLPRIQPTTQGRYWNSTNILKMIFIQLFNIWKYFRIYHLKISEFTIYVSTFTTTTTRDQDQF